MAYKNDSFVLNLRFFGEIILLAKISHILPHILYRIRMDGKGQRDNLLSHNLL